MDSNMMKAISLWQPWASLLACGAKQFETRSWATAYRGPIAIHAAAKSIRSILKECFPLGEWNYAPDYEAKKAFLRAVGKAFEDYASIEDAAGYMKELPLGCVIATADLVGVYPIAGGADFAGDPGSGALIQKKEGFSLVTGDELAFGDWTPGRYAWEFANIKMLDTPIPAKGKQGLWNWISTEVAS